MSMKELVSLLKSVIDIFAKQVSLNAFLIACATTFLIVAYVNANIIFGCIGGGIFLFVILNFIAKNFITYVNKISMKRFEKSMKNPDNQLIFLKSLDDDEFQVLFGLFESYPDGLFLSWVNGAVLQLNKKHCLLYIQGTFLSGNSDGNFGRFCSLQPWVKKCMDNHQEWVEERINLIMDGE